MIAKKHASYFNPLFVDGRELVCIAIYNAEGVVFRTKRGWIEHNNVNIETFYIKDVEVRNARKVDFKKGDVFLASVPEYRHIDKMTTLFIPEKYCKVEILPEVFKFNDGTDDVYQTNAKLTPLNGLVFGDNLESVTEYHSTRWEKTELGKEIQALQEEFPDLKNTMTSTLVKILKKYKLVER